MSEALNHKTLSALREFDEPGQNNFITELITLYLLDTETNFETIRNSLQAEDASKISMAAHAIKGSSLNIGAEALASVMQTLEREGKSGILCQPTQLSEAEVLFSDVRSALKAYLE